MKNKKLVIVLLAFVAVVGLVAGLWFGLQSKPQDTGAEGASFTVIVVHADKSEKTFSYTADGMLGDVLEEKGLISSEGADEGMFHTVDGEKADWNENQSYWGFYIEGEYAMTGIYATAIEDGATYKLEYTIG